MRELFIYYRVAAAHAASARERVQQLQRDLQARHPGLQARLLRRPGEAAGLQTWMEIYARPTLAGGVSTALERDIEQAAEALAPLLDGPRHCEVFEPI